VTQRKRTVDTTLEKGERGRLWAYGYADLARLLGVKEGALRARVMRGWNPGDLLGVAREIVRRQGP
jgi:hypothetical protein